MQGGAAGGGGEGRDEDGPSRKGEAPEGKDPDGPGPGGEVREGAAAATEKRRCGLPSCEAAATKRCNGCRTVSYCSREHQRAHRKAHKVGCRGTAKCGASGGGAAGGSDTVEGRETALASAAAQITGTVIFVGYNAAEFQGNELLTRKAVTDAVKIPLEDFAITGMNDPGAADVGAPPMVVCEFVVGSESLDEAKIKLSHLGKLRSDRNVAEAVVMALRGNPKGAKCVGVQLKKMSLAAEE